MKNRWIALTLALVVALAALAALAGAAVAEGFGDTPTTSLELGKGESLKLDTSSILAPEGQTLKFKSSDNSIATVTDEGVVTAKKKGKVAIAVGYDKTLLGLCKVTVVAAPKAVKLSDKYAILSTGDAKQLTAAVSGGTAAGVSFASSNEAVAAVDATGKVTAVSGGKATVTASTYNGRTAECVVYVLGGKAPSTLSLNTAGVNIQVGEVFKLIPSVDEGSDAYYKFTSQDRKIARVNSSGEVIGVKQGVTSVTVLTHNGLTQTVGVTVRARLKDVYGCLTNEPANYLKAAKKLKLTRDASAATGSVACGNGELSLTMTANSCQVALNAAADPRYCIKGIDVSMTPETAASKLIAAGWAMTGSKSTDGVEQRAFTRENDYTHYITISTADGTTIRGITAQWDW